MKNHLGGQEAQYRTVADLISSSDHFQLVVASLMRMADRNYALVVE